MELSNNIKNLISLGYEQECNLLQELVNRRINTDASTILDDYIQNERSYVDNYCQENDLDLVSELNSINSKRSLGLKLIENQIFTILDVKSKVDAELSNIDFNSETICLTNGIEDCPWLALFNSPKNRGWFNRRTSQVLDNIDPNHKYYGWLVETINNIKQGWIDPQDLVPDLDDYYQLAELKLPEEIKELVVKQSGN